MKNIIFLIGGLLLTNISISAQDAKTALTKIIDSYGSQNHLSFTIDYYYYDKLTDKTPSHDLKVKMVLGKEKYYAQSVLFELFHSKEGSVYIDHETKEINVQKNAKTTNAALDVGGLGLETILEQEGLSFTIFPEEKLSVLQITAPDYGNSLIELKYQPNSHWIEQVLVKVDIPDGSYFGQLDNQTKLEAFYTDYKTPKTAFPYTLKRFVQYQGQRIIPTKPYKNYKIISQ